MSTLLTRVFTYLTLATYLVVGTVAVRVFMPESVEVSFTTSYLSLFSETKVDQGNSTSELAAPEMSFEELIFPTKKITYKKRHFVKAPVKKTVAPRVVKQIRRSSVLPFYEPITLNAVSFNYQLPQNLIALYTPVKKAPAVMMVATETIKDEVSTNLSSNKATDAEPVFFEYPVEKVAETAPNEAPVENAVETKEEIAHIVSTVEKEIVEQNRAVDNSVDKNIEEVAVEDLVAFDYSSATQAVAQNKIPTVSKVNTQKPGKMQPLPQASKPQGGEAQGEEHGFMGNEKGFLPVSSHPTQMSIQVRGTDLKKKYDLKGFEVRFQDDHNDALGDFGQGSVTYREDMAHPKMTRSMKILKHGFAHTNTDLILEEGVFEVVIPAIEVETFNKMMEPFESKGAVGAVLVELDDKTELAQLDVPFEKVLLLDENFRETKQESFHYQLFLGVQAGNAVLSYQTLAGNRVSKIIHIHDRELTFDANLYEEVKNEKVQLFEEDLLAKEKAPLIISGDDVKLFATQNTARKLNTHTYQMNFGDGNLAARRYLELNHQREPIFVGVRNKKEVTVPSENFMRYVLSKFEGARLGNRCLIQVNLSKVAASFNVDAESVESSLMTYHQVLDSDGKFYESLSEKTQKILIVGENQGSPEISQEAKVNIKIKYLDGSTEYLSSYCSPNSYLVEQL